MPPGIVLEIVVNDKGTPVVRQFGSSVEGLNKQIRDSGQAVGTATSQTNALSASFLGGAKSAIGFGAAVLGFQGAASVVRNLAASVASFDAALANVNTLSIQSVQVQEQLRQQILRLPPALGDATKLARGLYEVISSGIEPTKAVAFLEQSARLARAGLADLDSTTAALTKTMAAFNIPAGKANEVTDILFKTVEIGQGSLQQFANAMPQVTQIAASMGLSLTDTANAMATLTQTFRNADTAGTGLRSLLSQLIQNSDKFLSLGINIRQVIGEQGIVGVARTLQTVAQGSSERLRVFINDIEGFNAAAALSGPQFATLVANQKKFGDATGAVSTALQKQTAAVTEAATEFGNTFLNIVNTLAPPFLNFTNTVLKGGTAFLESFRTTVLGIPKTAEQARADLQKIAPEFAKQVQMLLSVPMSNAPIVRTLQEQHAEIIRLVMAQDMAARNQNFWTTAIARADAELTKALKPLTEWRDESLRAAEAIKVAEQELKATNTAITQLQGALEALKPGELPKVLSVGDAQAHLDALLASLSTLATSSKISAREFEKAFADAVKVLEARFGDLSLTTRRALQDIQDSGERTRRTIETISTAVPRITEIVKEVRIVNGEAQTFLRTVEKLGPVTAESVGQVVAKVPRITDVIREVDAQGKITLRTIELFGPITAEAAEAAEAANLKKPFQDTSEAARKLEETLQAVIDAQLEFGRNFSEGLSETAAKAAFDLGLISRSALEMAQGVKHGVETAEAELNEFGNAVARTSDKTERLLSLRIQVDTPFAKDLEGLTKQLRDIERHMAQVANGFFGLDLAGRAFVIKQDQMIIAEIEKRIALLKGVAEEVAQAVQPIGGGGGGTTTPTGGGSRPISLPTGAGGDTPFPPEPGGDFRNPGPGVLRGGLGGIPDIPGLIFNAAGFIVGTRPPARLPEDPLKPPLKQAIFPQSSNPIPNPFGPGGTEPTPQRGGSHTVADGTLPGVTFPGGSLRGGPLISINALAITRQGAQELADAMGPALRELQRRGQL